MDPHPPPAAELIRRLRNKEATIGVIGLGYVGLPICLAAGEAGLKVLGFDIDSAKSQAIHRRQSYLRHIPGARIASLVERGLLSAMADFTRLTEPDAVLICVPTPLTAHLEPDLSFVVSTGRTVAQHLRRGQLIILESTTYPGTTMEVLRPILEAGGLKCDRDFFLAFSPEREDPGNLEFSTSRIPKVIGADSPEALEAAVALYAHFVTRTVTVSSSATAEAVKLTENIFRSVNIALVNELKIIFEAMGIDVWEVIEAAKTKPFGYMPFYPGPGTRRALHPHRSVLSHVEGTRVWDHDALHRAGRTDQFEHAAACGRQARTGARCQPRTRPARRPCSGRRRGVQEERRRHAGKPIAAADGDAGSAWRAEQLLRSVCARHTGNPRAQVAGGSPFAAVGPGRLRLL